MDNISVKHSCGDSALKCVDCNETVCPKCMVQCAVGNRCKKCTARFTSHVLKTSPKILIRLALGMWILGFVYGFVEPLLAFIPLGYISYIIQFVAFMSLGKIMHRLAAYKQGPKVAATAFFALLLGLMSGPSRAVLLNAFQNSGGDAYAAAFSLVGLTIFFLAVLWPFLRRS